VLDDVVANVMTGVHEAFGSQLDKWVNELKTTLGAPTDGSSARSNFADRSGGTGASGNASGGMGTSGGSSSSTSGGTSSTGGSFGASTPASDTGGWAPQTAADLSGPTMRAD
jgi:hypothetical protein